MTDQKIYGLMIMGSLVGLIQPRALFVILAWAGTLGLLFGVPIQGE